MIPMPRKPTVSFKDIYGDSSVVSTGDPLLDSAEQGMQNVVDELQRGPHGYVGGIQTTAVKVTANPTKLPDVPLPDRRAMFVQNRGAASIYIGNSNVTVGDGIEVAAGDALPLDIGPTVLLYAISAGASQDVRVLEVS